MSIDALFSDRSHEATLSCSTHDDDSRSTRKWGTKFRFNKKRYDELKEDSNFKLEF